MSCTCPPATDYSAPLTIGPLVTGDEWDGTTITVRVRNPDFNRNLPEDPVTNPRTLPASAAYTELERVLLQIHTSATNLDELLELDSDNVGEITIDQATNWIFTIEPLTFTLPAKTYFLAIACLRDGGGWKTFFKGELILTTKGVVV
jgi:hypothetical protein